MQHKKLILWTFILGLVACSNDYTPRESSPARTIYLEACAGCHSGEPENPKIYYWSIHPKNINVKYIAHKVNAGGLTMPSFPNIKGESMRKLTEYVLLHNLKK